MDIPLAAIPAALAIGAVAPMVLSKLRRKAKAKEALEAVDVAKTLKDAALLVALGFDPAKHRLRPVQMAGGRRGWRGMRVEDVQGHPLRTFSERQLGQPDVERRFKRALREVRVTLLDEKCVSPFLALLPKSDDGLVVRVEFE